MNMRATLTFDIYGTLFDTASVTEALALVAGHDAPALATLWRTKQLEYAFRRALMKRYADFSVCTAEALAFALRRFGYDLTDTQKEAILAAYTELAPFADTRPGLTRLKAAGYRLYAFSNGAASAVDALLRQAGLRDFFTDIISVAPTKSFKPDPAVYAHCLKETGTPARATWLISSNSFDVIGAAAFGMNTAWIRRTPNEILDPWGIAPTLTVTQLSELSAALAAQPD